MLRILTQSWKLLSPNEKSYLSFLSLSRILTNGLDILGIALIGAVGAVAFGAENPIPFFSDSNLDQNHEIMAMLLVAGVLFTLKTSVGLVLARSTMLYLSGIEAGYSRLVTNSIFSSSLRDFKEHSRPELEWAILRSTRTAFTVLLGQAITFVAELSLAILVFLFLFMTNWIAALAITCYFSLILAGFQFFSKKVSRKAGTNFSEGSIEVTAAISNISNAFREVLVFSKREYFLERLFVARAKVARAGATYDYLGAIPRLIVEMGLIVGAIGFVGFQFGIRGNSLDPVIVGVFLMGSLRMMSSLLPLQRSFMAIQYEAPGAAAAQQLLAEVSQNQPDGPNTREHSLSRELESLPADSGFRIEVRKMSFAFSKPTEKSADVVRSISLTVEEGQAVAFIGPSGAGKSTLLDLLMGLYLPTSGYVRFGGMSPSEFRRQKPGVIGYVPQSPGLVSGSFADNIAFGVPREHVNSKALENAVRIARLEDFFDSLPEGVNASVGKQADSMSGGQMQRLGLARALYTQPRILVLDEATSALDAGTEAAIAEALSELRGSVTQILVAHRLSTVKTADTVYLMEDGAISASGTFGELKGNNLTVQRYIELMALPDESS